MNTDIFYQMDEHELYVAIGRAAAENTKSAAQELKLEFGLPTDDMEELARRLISRIEKELFEVLCSEAKSRKKERDKLVKEMGIGEVATTFALINFISYLGLALSVAVPLAIFLRRFVLKPALDETCAIWKDKFS